MDKEQYQREIIVRLFQVSNALQTYMDAFLKKDSLTTKQFFMMIILGSFDTPPRIGEVSERFGTSRQNVKQVLLKLEKSGFVSLYKDELDSRITRVRFSQMALAFWENRESGDSETMNQVFEGISMDEFYNAKNVLLQLMDNLTQLKGEL